MVDALPGIRVWGGGQACQTEADKMKARVESENERRSYEAIPSRVLSVSTYPEWLANIVPVPKKDGKVRMCIDFRNLNKASPKDDFPLPHIDILVDNTAGHEMLSFMDALR